MTPFLFAHLHLLLPSSVLNWIGISTFNVVTNRFMRYVSAPDRHAVQAAITSRRAEAAGYPLSLEGVLE